VVDPVFSARAGNPYSDAYNSQWPDNAARFNLFCRVITALALDQAGLNWQPDIVHCNDWQTGLVPVYLAPHRHKPATLFTIHNLAYQGLFSYDTFKALGLDDSLWRFDALEFHNQLSFMKGGLGYADYINTVSPNYAKEVLTEKFGCGLPGLLRHRKKDFTGILNGIDQHLWNPVTDTYINKNYSSLKSSQKQLNKAFLRQRFELEEDDNTIIIGWVGRLVEQKGVDLLMECLPELLALPVQLVILGSGDNSVHKALKQWADKYPKQLAVAIGYSEELAHQIIAGADYFLMPSRFEPCGLTQLYSLRYGTLPIASKVGGLIDSITNTCEQTIADKTATGFLFSSDNNDEFLNAITQAIELYRNKPLYRSIQLCAMQQDFSWKKSAKSYLSIYRNLLSQRPVINETADQEQPA
jgi:starch synthase